MKLKDGQLYISPLNLNKERGEIQIPYVPVIRYATPIFDNAGSRAAILIVNIYADRFIADLKKNTEGKQFYLINEDGYFLVHPDESKEWGFMLNRDTRVQSDFSAVAQELMSRQPGTIGNFQDSIVSHAPVAVQKGGGRYWKLVLSASRSKVLEAVNEFWTIFGFSLPGRLCCLSSPHSCLRARSPTQSGKSWI